MLSHASVSDGFWARAMKIAVHVRNRSPNKILDVGNLEEAGSGKKSSYNHLHIFGCEAYSHVPKELRKKLDLRTRKCIFMTYG